MATAFINHPDCNRHDTGAGHPENYRRIDAITDHLRQTGLLDVLTQVDAPLVTREQLLRVHSKQYLEHVNNMIPVRGYARLDPDTVVCPESLLATQRAAGAVVAASNGVVDGRFDSAFCAVRPPGHHAERNRAMGFCIYNNVAVGVAHALEQHELRRIAIVDFDVHHGNGTEDIFGDDDRVLFCSVFQHPFYPFTPLLPDAPNRVSVPLPAGTGGDEFRAAISGRWLPALEHFSPEMIFVSAGFDAHVQDDMAGFRLGDSDFRWVSERIADVAERHAAGRMVSVLEGGYDLDSLARCADEHIRAIMRL